MDRARALDVASGVGAALSVAGAASVAVVLAKQPSRMTKTQQIVLASVSLAVGVLAASFGILRIFTSSAGAPGAPIVPGGRLLSRFGYRRRSDGSQQYHLGEDIAAPAGTPIYTPLEGTVMGVWPDGQLGGYGNTVVIRYDDGTAGLFAHMQRIGPEMVRGQRVRAGTQVGTVGDTNSAGGFTESPPHLHFEVLAPAAGDQRGYTSFHGGANWYPPRQDPASWAQARGIRLYGAAA